MVRCVFFHGCNLSGGKCGAFTMDTCFVFVVFLQKFGGKYDRFYLFRRFLNFRDAIINLECMQETAEVKGFRRIT